jgi:hypothetical protein
MKTNEFKILIKVLNFKFNKIENISFLVKINMS